MTNPFYSAWFMQAAEKHLLSDKQQLQWITVDGVGSFPTITTLRNGRMVFPMRKNLPTIHCFCGAPLPGANSTPACSQDLYLKLVPEDSPAHQALEAMPQAVKVGSHTRACIRPGLDYESFLKANLSTKKRKEFRRLKKRLQEQGTVEESWWQPGQDLDQWTQQFIELEALSWKSDKGTAIACNPAEVQFLHAILKGAAEQGELLLFRQTFDGKPIAMLICFQGDETIYTFKIAHDPEFARYSLGSQAMLAASQLILDEGLGKLMDSCAEENHPMINHLWPERRALNDWFIPHTLLGRHLVAPMMEHRYKIKMRNKQS